MAVSLNRASILGVCARDPEIRHTQAGLMVANLSVGTTHKWVDKEGVTQDRTTWHKVVAWGKLAEICEQHVFKGMKVYCDGPLQTEKYTGSDGVPREKTSIKAEQVVALGQRKGAQELAAKNVEMPVAKSWMADEIPF